MALYPDILPSGIPPASILQWTAAVGVLITTRAAVEAARLI
jgi:hypothetical protein